MARALFKCDLLPNLTKAIPLGFPSGLIKTLRCKIYPHDSKSSLISLSYALNESPWTHASNYPYSSSSWTCLGCYFLTTFKSLEAFLTGAFGFYYSYYSED